jgi:hypothetical protein
VDLIYDRGLGSGGTSWWLFAGFGFLASACAQEPVGERASSIVGGNPTSEYPAVLLLEAPDGGFCTGSLVAHRVILTAAHCQVVPGWTATVMDVDQPVASEEVVESVFHRYFHDDSDYMTAHDLSRARLAGDLPAELLPFVAAPFDEPPLAASLIGVGFGFDDGVALTGGGVKRVGAFSITWATDDYFVGDGNGTSVCYGDSGGPALMSVDGVATVVGVASGTGESCRSQSRWTRVDAHAADFAIPFVDAWSGPCRGDGTCVTDGCRTPDPDCAPCGIDGVCSAGCEVLDLDCPLAGYFGDACSQPDDCETRLCVEGDDGEATCSQICDDVDLFCPSGYRCEARDGPRVCVAIGAEGGCGCAAGGDGGRGSAALLLALAILLSRPACSRGRRRRRRCPGIP